MNGMRAKLSKSQVRKGGTIHRDKGVATNQNNCKLKQDFQKETTSN